MSDESVPGASTRMIELAEAAKAKSAMTCIELFDAMIAGIKRETEWRKQQLEQFAHMDDYISQANAEYAKAFEREAGALTTAEKKQALLDYVLKQGEGG